MPIDLRQLSDDERARMRAWVRRVERANPVVPKTDDEFFDNLLLSPLDDDERAEMERWRNASMDERARATAALLRHVDAVGNFPQDREMFPGFPPLWFVPRLNGTPRQT